MASASELKWCILKALVTNEPFFLSKAFTELPYNLGEVPGEWCMENSAACSFILQS